jgi:hypothetical protein
MNNVVELIIRAVAASTVTGVLLLTNSALAADSFTVGFPAGLACEFPLQIDGTGANFHMKEFKNGRIFSAGKGFALTFTNLDTSDTLPLKSNGFTQTMTNNPDGTQTVVLTGHNIVVNFPTDTPPGPSTTLYVGRVVIIVDSLGNGDLREASGNTVDLCAALS